MRELLRLHTQAHLRFYARSRLVLGFGVLVLGLWSLQLLPFFFLASEGSRFELLKTIAGQCRSVAWFLTAGLGLFTIATHLRARSVQLVLTRPGPPWAWLVSMLAAVFLVALSIQAVVLALTFGLSMVWGVPFQVGFVYQSIDTLFETLIVVSFLMAVGAAIHPVLAVLVGLIFNEMTFYGLDYMLQGLVHASRTKMPLSLVEAATRIVHLGLPMLDPFSVQMGGVGASLRVTPADWGYLAAAAGYSVVTTAFFLLVCNVVLRRRSFSGAV